MASMICVERLLEREPHLLRGEHDRLRQAGDEVAAADLALQPPPASGAAEPISSLTSSAVCVPIRSLYSRCTYLTIASSSSSPPTRIDCETTMPPSEMTATSVVPPPMSTIMLPVGSETGSPAPIAAAIGSSIR